MGDQITALLDLAMALMSPHMNGLKFFILLGASTFAANALFPVFALKRGNR